MSRSFISEVLESYNSSEIQFQLQELYSKEALFGLQNGAHSSLITTMPSMVLFRSRPFTAITMGNVNYHKELAIEIKQITAGVVKRLSCER